MNLATLIPLALKASVFLNVFALGLNARPQDATYLLRNPGRLARSLLSMYVLMPLLAAALAFIFDLHPAVKIALVTLAVAPVPPLLPKKAMKAGSEPSYAIGLLVAAALLSIVFTPLAVDLLGKAFGTHARIPPLAIARQPFKAALEGDAAYFHEAGAKAVLELLLTTHAGLTQEQFAVEARQFFENWRHPKLNRPAAEIIYQPMIELLAYLRRNGFQTWLCSGGTIDFMRAFAPQIYGVPVEQIIGSELKRESRMEGGRLVVWRLPEIDAINDKEGKPIGIDRQIGKRPVFVAGNVLSGGDIAMMQYSKGRAGPSFQLLINHDDAAREFAYAERDNASLDAAKKYGFTVVNIKSDWKTIFSLGQDASTK